MRFKIEKCEHQVNKPVNDEDEGYEGPVIVLANDSGLHFYFPILIHTAKLLRYIYEVHNSNRVEDIESVLPVPYELTDNDKIGYAQTVNIYQTMVNLWRDSTLFLSGILMDTNYSIESDDDIIIVYMILSDEDSGMVSSVVRINFQHALSLVALLNMEINVSEYLLHKLAPRLFEDEDDESGEKHAKNMPQMNEENTDFPIDNRLLDTAKAIFQEKEKGNPKKKGKKKE